MRTTPRNHPAPATRPPRRLPAVLLAAVLTALLGAACGSGSLDYARRRTNTPGTGPEGTIAAGTTTTVATPSVPLVGDAKSKVPMTGYKPKFSEATCALDPRVAGSIKVDCGTLTVPESRFAPDKTIKLAVAILRSTSPTPKPDPVVFLQGGPGGSAIAITEIWTEPVSPILADRDIILIDQRGTGYSIPSLTCDQDGYRVSASLWTQCISRMRAQGVNVGAYNTDENAADIADLRKALGLAEWNIVGVSYGTRLGLAVMSQHPDGIRSVVLDSNFPPDVRAFEEGAQNFAEGVGALFADCRADPACNRAYPNLEQRFYATIDRFGLEGAELVNIVFQSLYYSELIPWMPRALDAIAKGDLDGFYEVMDMSSEELRSGGSTTTTTTNPLRPTTTTKPVIRYRPRLSEGLFFTIMCAEEAHGVTAEAIKEASAGVVRQIRDPVVDENIATIEICEEWRVTKRTLGGIESTAPTLVLAGPYDPITPVRWSEQTAAAIPGSRLVVIHNAGHAAISAGDCPMQLVKRFLDDPASMGGDDCGTAPAAFNTG